MVLVPWAGQILRAESRGRVLQSLPVRLAEWHDRHVAWSVVVRGTTSGVAFGVFPWLAPTVNPSAGKAVIAGCVFAATMTLFGGLFARRAGRTFPPGLDLNSRIMVRRVVRHGYPITDTELAPAFDHYARAVLAVPFQSVLSSVVFGLGSN
jgi:hypothetical protein